MRSAPAPATPSSAVSDNALMMTSDRAACADQPRMLLLVTQVNVVPCAEQQQELPPVQCTCAISQFKSNVL